LRIESETMLVVRDTVPDSPADRAGLRAGDTILAVDDQPVLTLHDFFAKIHAGRAARVRIRRGDETPELRVTPVDAIEARADAGGCSEGPVLERPPLWRYLPYALFLVMVARRCSLS
jgi:predicted metalloprotease with PDZ domain